VESWIVYRNFNIEQHAIYLFPTNSLFVFIELPDIFKAKLSNFLSYAKSLRENSSRNSQLGSTQFPIRCFILKTYMKLVQMYDSAISVWKTTLCNYLFSFAHNAQFCEHRKRFKWPAVVGE